MFKIKKSEADVAYRDGKPIMSDAEYDTVFGTDASDMDTDLLSPLTKVSHDVFMHSLAKMSVIEGFDKVYKWCGSNTLIVSWKYDGLAVELIYKKGKFQQAITRGDGNIGELITHNVIKMKNFYQDLDDDFSGSLRAEIVMKRSDYAKYLAETLDQNPYSNTRNGASGAARSMDGRNAAYCSLMYYGVDDDNPYESDYTQFVYLKGLFDDVVFNTANVKNIKGIYQQMSEQREDLDFDVDGIVVAINSPDVKEARGFDTRNRPRFKLAIKFPYYEKETVLRNIVWSNGKSGHVTPVAEFDTIDLGASISKASLANLNVMQSIWKAKQPRVGDVLMVSRRGDVIPNIESLLRSGDGEFLMPPKNCSVCGTKLSVNGPFLVCSNVSCSSKSIGNIEHWLNKIKGHFRIHCMGPETVAELFELGVIKDVDCLYKLTSSDLVSSLNRCGSRLAKNMLNFQDCKIIPLHIFMGAINIENIGTRVWSSFIENTKYKTLASIMELTEAKILASGVEGIGQSRATAMYVGLQHRKDMIFKLLELGIVVSDALEVVNKNTPISGKSFCVTGSLSLDRSAFEGKIKELGGIVKGVSKKLDYLVVGNLPGMTKLDKAEKYNIKMITEEEFNQLLKE